MNIENQVMTARTVGYFDNMDGRTWANAVRANTPLVVILDLQEVDRICPTLVKVMAEVSRTAGLRSVLLVVSSTMSSQTARMVDKLAEYGNVRALPSYEEAEQQARITVSKAQSKAAAVSFARGFSFAAAW